MTVEILTGDCIDQMLFFVPNKSVRCCVTSPPYFGLRDYGHAGQIGHEPTVDDYVAKMVEVFRQVREVLTDDGTLWLNLGDSYAGTGGLGVQSGKEFEHRFRGTTTVCRSARVRPHGVLKTGDVIGIPWRVAFALQADGWYLRQDIVWAKPNPMPESVRNRCTKAHEYIFLLAKSKRYHCNMRAIQEPLATSSVKRLAQDIDNQAGSDRVPGKKNGKMKAVYTKPYTGQSTKDYAAGGAQDASATKARIVDRILSGEITGRNKRSVWTVTTKPFKGAHFATFPPDLIEPCILAGSEPGDTVLDPFGGAGTTAVVAKKHGRNAVLCELNPEYVAIAEQRLAAC